MTPFIICEIGSNFRTLDDCLLSIRSAKACGADACKFQLYSSRALYGYVPVEHFPEGVMDPTWLPELHTECERVGIEMMCSAFSPELIDVVNPFVKRHKVASAEMTHVRMLEKLRQIGKPVILSTGASGYEDIAEAVRILGDTPVTLLYCVAAYPARVINPWGIKRLASEFGLPVGFSDHSTDALIIPVVAMGMGASVIEKHVTFIDAETPDSPHSLNEREFKLMVDAIRNPHTEEDMRIGPTEAEQGMVTRHNRRLIATCDIEAGEVFHEGENFGIYRSLKDDSKALSPFLIDRVNGSVAKRRILAGDGIAPGDL